MSAEGNDTKSLLSWKSESELPSDELLDLTSFTVGGNDSDDEEVMDKAGKVLWFSMARLISSR